MKQVKSKSQIEKRVAEYFKRKSQIDELEQKQKQIEKEINDFCDSNLGGFVEGAYKLGNCMIKITSNPPKLVNADTGKALTNNERDKLVLELDRTYVQNKPDMKKMINNLNTDKCLKKLLESKDFIVRQDAKYTVALI